MQWTTGPTPKYENLDIEVIEEAALARAQASIYRAMKASGVSKADLARGMGKHRSFITRMLGGSHNLTVKTFAKALAACGFELRFERAPIQWRWHAEAAVVVGDSMPTTTADLVNISDCHPAAGQVPVNDSEVTLGAIADRELQLAHSPLEELRA